MTLGIVIVYQTTAVPPLNFYTTSQTSILTYSNGNELGRVFREDRSEISITEVPKVFQNAILAAEDSNFYSHIGFDLFAITRAVIKNTTTDKLQGGSTITQQYVKIAYLSPDQNISRKIKEIFLALKIENRDSKSEILEKYINAVYFGRNAYGVEMAARKYFGVAAKELNPAQSITLAALVRSPARYDPSFNPRNLPRLKSRFDDIKLNMVSKGWLLPEESKNIIFPEVPARILQDSNAGNLGHLIASIKLELSSLGIDEDELSVGGYRVQTTFDQNAQRFAELSVESERPKDSPLDLHIGLASIRPGTGEVIALYGGQNYLERQLNDATQSIAQAGSTFKVFAIIAALKKGYSLSTVWNGKSPQTFLIPSGIYKVSNYGNSSFGPVSLYRATSSSINTVFVKLGTKVGAQSVVDAARLAGIPSEVQVLATPSVVLGVSSPRVIDVASSFATFAANGIYAKPYIVKKIIGPGGKTLYEAKIRPKRVFSQEVMADLTYALTGVVRNGTASSVLAGFPRPIAGKTGTSQDNASAWFTGYSPDLSTSVAFFRDTPAQQLTGIGGLNSITGGTFPARIWNIYMKKALAEYPVSFFPRPAFIGGTRTIYIDVPSPSPSTKNSLPISTFFQPKPVPITSTKPVPITSTKPVPITSTKPVPITSTKPVPITSTKPVPITSTKPVPITSTKPVPTPPEKTTTNQSPRPIPGFTLKPPP